MKSVHCAVRTGSLTSAMLQFSPFKTKRRLLYLKICK